MIQISALQLLKAREIWMIVCLIFVGGAILEFSIIKYIFYMVEKRYEEILNAQLSKSNLSMNNFEKLHGIVFCGENEKRRVKVPPSLFNEMSEHNRPTYGMMQMQNLVGRHINLVKSMYYQRTFRPTKSSSTIISLTSRNAIMKDATNTKYTELHSIIDWHARICFPATFLMFNIVYWPVLFSWDILRNNVQNAKWSYNLLFVRWVEACFAHLNNFFELHKLT